MDRFCARCAGALSTFDDHGVPRKRCGSCGRVAYRNSKPCVGAIWPRDGAVLLSLRRVEPHAGEWDLPGGFLEAGEHPEDGVVRELVEETGLRVRVVRLVCVDVGCYHDDHTLNLVYEVAAEGEPRAASDAAQLRFWPLDALPPLAFPHERRALQSFSST